MTLLDKRRLFITGAGSQDTSLAFWDASSSESDSEDTRHPSNGKKQDRGPDEHGLLATLQTR
jgi:hypothetical protein